MARTILAISFLCSSNLYGAEKRGCPFGQPRKKLYFVLLRTLYSQGFVNRYLSCLHPPSVG